jgi:radical SAM superfamily enzyme YgiQ (UPF0313 family)
MKVLLVCKSKVMENLGVMYLASVVKKAGHEAKIVSLLESVRTAKEWNPDIIGYSIMTGDEKKFEMANGMMKNLWSKRKRPVSIVGGPDPCFFPQGYEWADHIVRGEGENWMADFLASKRPKADAYPDIDSIPWPDRTDFPGMRIRDFIASRGCPNKCRYCFNDQWATMFPDIPRVRSRSADDVIAEIKSTNPKYVYFQDSCFAVSTTWLKEFSKKYSSQIKTPFQCHMRPNQITEERVKLLANCNCMSIRIALESASSRLRVLLGRSKITIADVRLATGLLKKKGIKVMLQNMIGLPDGTIEDDLETLSVNIRCKPTYAWVSIFQPYPGTEMGKFCEQEGWFDGNYSEITDSFFDTSVLNFTPEYVEQLECLQKIFDLCVQTEYLPEARELTHTNFPKLVHKIMRRLGDKKLYGGVI